MRKLFLFFSLILYTSCFGQGTINANLFKGGKLRLSDSLNVNYTYSLFGSGSSVELWNRINPTNGRWLWKINSTDVMKYDLQQGE